MITGEAWHICPAVHGAEHMWLVELVVAALWLADRLSEQVFESVALTEASVRLYALHSLMALRSSDLQTSSVCVFVFQHIQHRWVWSRQREGCSQGRVRRTQVTKKTFQSEKGKGKAAVRIWPWGVLSCRGQSAAAKDGRHDSGQRAHLHRWGNRNADMLLYTTGCSSVSEGFVYPTLSLSVCLLSGKRVGGQKALEMGLVNRSVEQNETGDAALREALSLAREILPQVREQHTLSHSATDASPPFRVYSPLIAGDLIVSCSHFWLGLIIQ